MIRKITAYILLIFSLIFLAGCGDRPQPADLSTPLFEFINSEETNRLLQDIKNIPVAYLEFTLGGKRDFRTAITNQSKIMEAFEALKEVSIVEEAPKALSEYSYTWRFRMDNGYTYDFAFYDNTMEIDEKTYRLCNHEKAYFMGKEIVENALPDPSSLYQPGDIVYFGVYEQDNNIDNGKEKIAWRVLDAKADRILVISDVCIDKMVFHPADVPITWEDSMMRRWLNTDFFDSTFSEDEKNSILETSISNTKNSMYGYEPLGDTIDKVFLLSESEAYKYFDENNDEWGGGIGIKAGYSESIKAVLNKWGPYESDYIYWWLRTPGNSPGKILSSLLLAGSSVDIRSEGLRPAMWVMSSGID